MGAPVYSDECFGGGFAIGGVRGEYDSLLTADYAFHNVVGGGHRVNVLEDKLW
jgi:hypothetical protein